MFCHSLAELPSWRRNTPHRLATTAYYIYSQLPFITGGSILQAQPDDEQCLRDKVPTHASAARKVNARITIECGHINRIQCSRIEIDSNATTARTTCTSVTLNLSMSDTEVLPQKHLGDDGSNHWAGRNLVSVPRARPGGRAFTLEQVMKAQRGSRGIALLFLYPRR